MSSLHAQTTIDPQKVQAHRGASAKAPENTLAAFRAAAEQGARWVELDVALSRDGTLVVIHDDSVDRTTSGKGSLGDLTLAELQALDAGSWFGKSFAAEPLPTLSAALAELARLKLGVNIEIKQHAHHRSLEQLIDAVDAAIEERPQGSEIMISSFDPEALKAMGERRPDLELAMLWLAPPADWREQLASIPAKTVHLHYKDLTLRFLEETNQLGIKVRV